VVEDEIRFACDHVRVRCVLVVVDLRSGLLVVEAKFGFPPNTLTLSSDCAKR
jgi:hypothetical protein